MKEDMFDVLLYLFQNFISEPTDNTPESPEVIASALENAGFPNKEIDKAFSWLEGLANLQALNLDTPQPIKEQSFRIFNDEEYARLGPLGIGFILFLEQYQVIDAETRELIMDRLLALENFEIDLEQVKWVALIVIYHQHIDKDDLEFVEELLFIDNSSEILH